MTAIHNDGGRVYECGYGMTAIRNDGGGVYEYGDGMTAAEPGMISQRK